MKMLAALENQKRDHQSQIDQLKWEARFGQMEQQLLAARTQQIQPSVTSIPTQYIANATNGTPQQQMELLRQRNQMLELKISENENHQLASSTPFVESQPVPLQSTNTPVALPSAALPSTALPSAMKQQAPSNASKQEPPKPQSIARTSGNVPSAALQHQRQVVTGPAKGGSVPLPDDAHTHFFLSHCQASGGDQTNAIYLELKQLGFLCW